MSNLLNQEISQSLTYLETTKSSSQVKTSIKVISSLQSFQKESFYTSTQDSHNPILSHNYHLIITTEHISEHSQLIYYNYGSNDAMLKAKHYWIDGLLKKLLHIFETKKVKIFLTEIFFS